MLIEEAILGRQSVKVFDPKPVPPELIQRCLALAVWAPNHHLTEPWHFTVVSGAARTVLADAVHDDLTQGVSSVNALSAEAKAVKERRKLHSAPVLIAVYSTLGSNAQQTQENYAATAAAVQNLLLSAHGFGLGAIWRTGAIYHGPAVRTLLQSPEGSVFVGTVFVGYSAQRDIRRHRSPVSHHTVWLGDGSTGDPKSQMIGGDPL